MDSWVGRKLLDLRLHWGTAYKIDVDDAGTAWEARPRSRGGTTLTAATDSDLREAMRADYWRRSRLKLVAAGRR